MSEYEIAKDVTNITQTQQRQELLLEQLYAIIEHNIKRGTLKEPPKKKE